MNNIEANHINKVLLLLLTCFFFYSCDNSKFNIKEYLSIKGEKVNIRNQANQDGEILFQLNRGDTAIILEKSNAPQQLTYYGNN